MAACIIVFIIMNVVGDQSVMIARRGPMIRRLSLTYGATLATR